MMCMLFAVAYDYMRVFFFWWCCSNWFRRGPEQRACFACSLQLRPGCNRFGCSRTCIQMIPLNYMRKQNIIIKQNKRRILCWRFNRSSYASLHRLTWHTGLGASGMGIFGYCVRRDAFHSDRLSTWHHHTVSNIYLNLLPRMTLTTRLIRATKISSNELQSKRDSKSNMQSQRPTANVHVQCLSHSGRRPLSLFRGCARVKSEWMCVCVRFVFTRNRSPKD